MRQRPQFAHSGRQTRGLAPQPGGENPPQGQQHLELRAASIPLRVGKGSVPEGGQGTMFSDTGFERSFIEPGVGLCDPYGAPLVGDGL